MAKKTDRKRYVRNLQDLIDHFGADSAENLNRRVYKDTGCGASISVHPIGDEWLHNGQDKRWATVKEIDAFTIQTIVEGSDATVDSPTFTLPVTHIDINKWIEEMEAEAERLWNEANTTSYRIECGNSTTGAVGAVAYVEAHSPMEAQEKLMEALEGHEGESIQLDQDIEVRVYFGTKKWGKAEEAE